MIVEQRTTPLRPVIATCLVLGASCFLPVAGCGPGNPLGREALSGTVTLDGEPLATGSIEFAPLEPGGVSSGETISGGRYDIGEIKGLPPGKYRVRIYSSVKSTAPPTPEEAALPELHRPGVERIAPRFNAASELVAEVTAEGPNRFDFQVSSK